MRRFRSDLGPRLSLLSPLTISRPPAEQLVLGNWNPPSLIGLILERRRHKKLTRERG